MWPVLRRLKIRSIFIISLAANEDIEEKLFCFISQTLKKTIRLPKNEWCRNGRIRQRGHFDNNIILELCWWGKQDSYLSVLIIIKLILITNKGAKLYSLSFRIVLIFIYHGVNLFSQNHSIF